MRTVASLIVLVLSGTAGDLSISRVMKRVGAIDTFSPPAVARCLGRALRHASMWIGVALHVCAFVAFLALLSWADVSFVVPASALSYVAGVAGARLFLRERITVSRWAGVMLISFGVLFVLMG
jgi:EamA-like transporter family protein